MDKKLTPIFALIIVSFFLCCSLYSQKDSATFKPYKTLSISAGSCGTLDFYKNHGENDYNYVAPAGLKPVYFGPSASFLFSSLKSRHYMFQTGLEYALCPYFIANISMNEGHNYYSNVMVYVNDFNIPIYFNALFFKQKVFVGIGPSLGILPYSPNHGLTRFSNPAYTSGYSTFTNYGWLFNNVEINLAIKTGAYFSIKNHQFFVEGRFNYGITDVIRKSYYPTLHNDYVSLSLGYVFWKR